MLYLVINLDGTYSDNENETKRLRSNSGLNSRNADSLSNQNRSSGRIRQVLIIDYSYNLEADFPRSSKHPCPHHVLEESRNLKKENEALKERVSFYPKPNATLKVVVIEIQSYLDFRITTTST